LVKFNEYGQKIEIDKNKPTLDFVTSYGYYQGHYITEPWKDSSNWYMGLKAGIPWETNTLNTALTTEHSRPKFGQTSPTSSSTLSSELTFLDNFKRVSDKKKSDVDLQRAISDYNETTKTISFEVQDAFLSHKKAIIQFATAEADMKYRRNQADVIKIRSMVGDASLSDAIESLYSFSDAQTKYFQALATAQISLTNLKKACGYGFQI
jgi:outer membrane protein TolC